MRWVAALIWRGDQVTSVLIFFIGILLSFPLFAFFYGLLHFTTYIWLDKFFDVHAMLDDIAKDWGMGLRKAAERLLPAGGRPARAAQDLQDQGGSGGRPA